MEHAIEEVESTLEQDARNMKEQCAYAILMKSLKTKVATQFGLKVNLKDFGEAIHAMVLQLAPYPSSNAIWRSFYEGEPVIDKLVAVITLKVEGQEGCYWKCIF